MSTTQSKKRPIEDSSGCVFLLDTPPGTTITLDGYSRILDKGDTNFFAGFSDIPSNRFHFLCVRRSCKNNISSAIGLVLYALDSRWNVARRYDPRTEEVSGEDGRVDEVTIRNLEQAVYPYNVDPRRIAPYKQFFEGGDGGDDDSDGEKRRMLWSRQTSYISTSLLQRRNINHGDKIVPGCYVDDTDNGECNKLDTKTKTCSVNDDGIQISYPPIPCISSGKTEGDGGEVTERVFTRNKHVGTRKYLAMLSPSQRTQLFLCNNDVLDDILERYYGGKWEDLIGDLQLSFLLFLYLGCLSSLEHWRDLLSMLSLVTKEQVQSKPDLFCILIKTLSIQLRSIESDFFEEVDLSGGNFLTPALKQLYHVCSTSFNDNINENMEHFQKLIFRCFNIRLDGKTPENECALDDMNNDNNFNDVFMYDESNPTSATSHSLNKKALSIRELNNDDESEDDNPVVVSMEEMEASMSRIAEEDEQRRQRQCSEEKQENHRSATSKEYRLSYPLLFAAMAPQEDVLMACARILDEASDVSLVREAAAYLEEVESKKMILE